MNKFTLLLTALAICVTAVSADAATPQPAVGASSGNSLSTGTLGLTVTTSSNSMISGKYLLSNDTALLGGFGLVNTSNGVGTDIYLMAGIRKYIIKANMADNFVPFMGARVWHSTVNSTNMNGFGISAEGGAEYFLSKHFSLEGLVSANFGSTSPSGGSATSQISTSVYSLGANFYF